MEINIDDELREQLERRADRTGFDSAQEYSVFVLEIVMDQLENEPQGAVENRLKDLGYL